MPRTAVRALAPVVLAGLVFALGACGGGGSSSSTSASDQSLAKVCDARSDISKQIDALKNLKLSASTASDVSQSVQAIGADVAKITDARAGLTGDRRQEVDSALQTFQAQLKDIGKGLTTNLTLSGARSQLDTAVKQLETAFRQTFAKIDCG